MKMKNKKMVAIISALGIGTLLFTGCTPVADDDDDDDDIHRSSVVAPYVGGGKSINSSSGIKSSSPSVTSKGSTGIGGAHGGGVSS